MKCATPTWPAASSRDPARTYAAMETERAVGSRALITRGPAGSAVRSNIRSMVQESFGRPRQEAGGGRWIVERRRAYLMTVWIQVFAK